MFEYLNQFSTSQSFGALENSLVTVVLYCFLSFIHPNLNPKVFLHGLFIHPFLIFLFSGRVILLKDILHRHLKLQTNI
jgi:hypothetical protein